MFFGIWVIATFSIRRRLHSTKASCRHTTCERHQRQSCVRIAFSQLSVVAVGLKFFWVASVTEANGIRQCLVPDRCSSREEYVGRALGQRSPCGRWYPIEHVSKPILFLCVQDDHRAWSSGVDMCINGWGRLPCDDVLGRIQIGINPPLPLFIGTAFERRKLETE